LRGAATEPFHGGPDELGWLANSLAMNSNGILHAICCAAFGLSSAACTDLGSQIFDLTVRESSTLRCDIESHGYSNPKELVKLAFDTERNWEEVHRLNPVEGVGARLHVVTTEEATNSWFEQIIAQGINNSFTGGSAQVFEGKPQPSYVQGFYVHKVLPPPGDEVEPLGSCGEQVPLEEDLAFTVSDGQADGRLKVIERVYLPQGFLRCAAVLTCTRMLSVLGAEAAF
jgi:hypothetical protein